MNQSNYALLTALYDSQSSDLYKDIYFPIIKYSIFLLYQKQTDTTKYYDTTNIQEVIIEKFGIKIPLIVIKQSLKIIPMSIQILRSNYYKMATSYPLRKYGM